MDPDNPRSASRQILAYLGPAGTYSHQAANDRFSEIVDYLPQNTISDAFHSVGPSAHLALLPQENSIFGTVTETYDLLRSSELGKSKWIRGAVTLSIQHCLVVQRGKTVQDIKRVLSHEQALGQCRQFVTAHLPEARLISVASTAAAAEMVSTQDDAADSAAICSKICLQLFADLEILHEGIQDEHNNSTRFYILANNPSSPLPNTPNEWIEERNALIRLEVLPPKAVSQDAPVTVSDLLAALRLPASRIDRRPSTSAPREQFGSMYFVEVMDTERSDGPASSPQHQQGRGNTGKAGMAGLVPWKERVLAAVARVVERGGRADLLGTW